MANGRLAYNPISSVPNTAVTMVATMDGKKQGELPGDYAGNPTEWPRRKQLLAGPAPVQRSCFIFVWLPGWPVADLPSPALNNLPCTKMTDDIVERINGEIRLCGPTWISPRKILKNVTRF